MQHLGVIAKLPPNRKNAASEGRRLGEGTTQSFSDEAIALRREGGWDESFAMTSLIYHTLHGLHITILFVFCTTSQSLWQWIWEETGRILFKARNRKKQMEGFDFS
ncbi:MAG: hypothetical protein IJJ26_07045 [Victivallales bacterium]|nr:hypothetical protein [Victivallales bacterium]